MSIESEIADALRHRRPETYGPGLRQEQNSSEESMQIASAGLKKSKFEFVAAMIAAMTIPAHGSTIVSDATFFASATDNIVTLQGGSPGNAIVAPASMSATGPMLSASVTGDGAAASNPSAQAGITYYLELIGPDGNVPVDL